MQSSISVHSTPTFFCPESLTTQTIRFYSLYPVVSQIYLSFLFTQSFLLGLHLILLLSSPNSSLSPPRRPVLLLFSTPLFILFSAVSGVSGAVFILLTTAEDDDGGGDDEGEEERGVMKKTEEAGVFCFVFPGVNGTDGCRRMEEE